MTDYRAAAQAAQKAFEEWFGETPVQRVVPTDVEGHEIWALLFDGESEGPEPARSSGVVSKIDAEEPASEPSSGLSPQGASLALASSQDDDADDEDDEFDDDDDDDVPLHFVATAGLSALPIGPSKERFELVLPVSSPVEVGELADVAQFLRAVAQVFSEPDSELDRHLLIETGEIPLFEGMSWLMITPWDSEAHEVLPGLMPPVTILCVTPLYPGEAAKLQTLPEGAAMAWFEALGIDLDDPMRPDASEPRAMPSSFELTQAMNNMMAHIGAMAAEILGPAAMDVDGEDGEMDDLPNAPPPAPKKLAGVANEILERKQPRELMLVVNELLECEGIE
ncbi:MAG: suppressor of fused domain protein [Polyangiaceae bacterium]